MASSSTSVEYKEEKRAPASATPSGSTTVSTSSSLVQPLTREARDLKDYLLSRKLIVDEKASRDNELVVVYQHGKTKANLRIQVLGENHYELSDTAELYYHMEEFFPNHYHRDRSITERPNEAEFASKDALYQQIEKIHYFYALKIKSLGEQLTKSADNTLSFEYLPYRVQSREDVGYVVNMRECGVQRDLMIHFTLPCGYFLVEGEKIPCVGDYKLRDVIIRRVRQEIAREQKLRLDLYNHPNLKCPKLPIPTPSLVAENFLLKNSQYSYVLFCNDKEAAVIFRTDSHSSTTRTIPIIFSEKGEYKLQGAKWVNSVKDFDLQVQTYLPFIKIKNNLLYAFSNLLKGEVPHRFDASRYQSRWRFHDGEEDFTVQMGSHSLSQIEFNYDATRREWGTRLLGSDSEFFYGNVEDLAIHLFYKLEDLYYSQVNKELPPLAVETSTGHMISMDGCIYLAARLRSRTLPGLSLLDDKRENLKLSIADSSEMISVSYHEDKSFLVHIPGTPPKTLRTACVERISEEIQKFSDALEATKRLKLITEFKRQLMSDAHLFQREAKVARGSPSVFIHPDAKREGEFAVTFNCVGTTPVTVPVNITSEGLALQGATEVKCSSSLTAFKDRLNLYMKGAAPLTRTPAQETALKRLQDLNLLQPELSLREAQEQKTNIVVCYPAKFEAHPQDGGIKLAVVCNLPVREDVRAAKRAPLLTINPAGQYVFNGKTFPTPFELQEELDAVYNAKLPEVLKEHHQNQFEQAARTKGFFVDSGGSIAAEAKINGGTQPYAIFEPTSKPGSLGICFSYNISPTEKKTVKFNLTFDTTGCILGTTPSRFPVPEDFTDVFGTGVVDFDHLDAKIILLKDRFHAIVTSWKELEKAEEAQKVEKERAQKEQEAAEKTLKVAEDIVAQAMKEERDAEEEKNRLHREMSRLKETVANLEKRDEEISPELSEKRKVLKTFSEGTKEFKEIRAEITKLTDERKVIEANTSQHQTELEGLQKRYDEALSKIEVTGKKVQSAKDKVSEIQSQNVATLTRFAGMFKQPAPLYASSTSALTSTMKCT